MWFDRRQALKVGTIEVLGVFDADGRAGWGVQRHAREAQKA
jgi:hypothetical protein